MKFEFDWRGDTYECEWVEGRDFSKLKNVSGVQGFIFDEKGKFCIVNAKSKGCWSLVGGGLEDEDETYEDALIRETLEEADLEIENIIGIGYVQSKLKCGDDEPRCQLKYFAKVKKINEPTLDPAENEITERKFILPEEFEKYCGWGKNGEIQLKKALEILNVK